MKKGITIGVLVGAMATITAYHAYIVYSLHKQVDFNTGAVNEIVKYINQSNQQSNGDNQKNDAE